MHRRQSSLTTLLLAALPVFAGGEPNWPCYHGPERDNRSSETGLLESWPAEGPKLLWTAIGLGDGYSSVAAAGGRLYVRHADRLFAYELRIPGTRHQIPKS